MFVVFVMAGLLFATWFARLPVVRDLLELQPDTLGLILLFGSCGSLLAMPLTGLVVSKIGTRATILVGAALACAGLSAAASAAQWGTPTMLAAAMFVSMTGIGSWDVAMNFAGARVEQGLRRAIMPWFHAGFSLGSVAGAAIGTLASRSGIELTTHVFTGCAVIFVLTVLFSAGILRDEPAAQAPDPGVETEGSAAATTLSEPGVQPAGPIADVTQPAKDSAPWWSGWTEPRTVLIGVVVLAAALTEGAAADWLALAVVDGFGVENHVGAFGFTIFVTAMTVMRFAGVFVLAYLSRVTVLRLCVALAIVGLALFTLAPSMPLALVGAVLWGLGAALGFPIGMSAASDDPQRAAARLSVVSTIGYTAFLAGPPALGLLASHVGYRYALLAIMVPLVVGLFATRAAEPLAGSDGTAKEQRGDEVD